jgi:predicted RNase H-like HicB family nuclease
MATSAKSKSSVKVLAEHRATAAKLADKYRITLWREEDGWYARCVELPNCMGDGDTPEAAIASTRQAIIAGLATDLARGLPAPLPAREGVRSVQVNVRLSPDEREVIEANAIQAGFKGMADYIRAVALGFRTAHPST